MSKDVYILGIESSCDETAAAVVKNGREVLSNIISSQIVIHRKFGGVVPEIASRKHIENILPVIDEALRQANVKLEEIDAVAVTYGPGLVGALLVGVSAAKALAWANDKPLIGVNHLEGHVFANFLNDKDLEPPFMALVVSGGHTALLKVTDYNSFELLGQTRDDAAGEAFDKIARVMGLQYPGGPEIEKLAAAGDPQAIDFPRALLKEDYQFSFSGLKSAVINYLHNEQQAGRDRAPLFLTPEEKAYLAEHNHFTAFASPSRCPIPTLNELPPYHAAKHDERFPSPGREHRESELRPGTRPALRPLRPGHARPVPLKQASRRARAQGVRPAGVRRLVPAEIRPRDEKARRCGGARALAES